MYMDDAIKATVELMEAPPEKVKVRSSYNLAAMTFTPQELATEIKKHIPEFKLNYDPDYRQEIANSWPSSINDNSARNDWGWDHEYDLAKLTEKMLSGLRDEQQ